MKSTLLTSFIVFLGIALPCRSQSAESAAQNNGRAEITFHGNCSPEAQELVKTLPLSYPGIALMSRTEGSVEIEIAIDSSGKIQDARVISGVPLLSNAILPVVRRWTPPPIDGVAGAASVKVSVNYKLLPDLPDQRAPVPFPDAKNSKHFKVTMERSKGDSVYRLTIHGNGLVEYRGVEGRRHARITRAEVNQLLDAFQKANYFSFQDTYDEFHQRIEIGVLADGCSQTRRETISYYLTDVAVPPTVTSLTIGGKTKTVTDMFGAPSELETLEDQIDELSHSQKWVSNH